MFKILKNEYNYDNANELPDINEFVKLYKELNTGSVCKDDFYLETEKSVKYCKLVNSVECLDKPITKEELYKAVKRLNNGKACGDDLVTNEMLKSAVNVLEEPILNLFNMCLNTGVYPDKWCSGHIIPLHKSGTRTDVNNYRPITISSCFGKLLNSILNDRIVSYLDNNNLMSNVQIGFLKGHRPSDHVLLLKGMVDLYKEKGKHIYACFVDFKAAFDNVWHAGLMYKLRNYGISSKIINLLYSMYSKLKTCVKKGSYMSTSFSCNVGTRQGCNLSPTLFKMFIDDIYSILNENECNPINIDGMKLGCLLYADDIVILSNNAKGLQTSLDKLNTYRKKWRLKVNTYKTKTMVFNCRKSKNIFKFGNYILEDVNRVCYLGFILTPSCKFSAAIKHLYDKANNAVFALRTKIKCLPYYYYYK